MVGDPGAESHEASWHRHIRFAHARSEAAERFLEEDPHPHSVFSKHRNLLVDAEESVRETEAVFTLVTLGRFFDVGVNF